MNNSECNIARDLMPLVIDQVASEESRTLVEAHAAACEPCAQVYNDMQAKTPEKSDTAEDNSFSAAMRQLRRTVEWRRIKLIVSGVAIMLLLLAVGIWGNQYLLVEYNRDMPLDWYNMSLSRTKDGTGLVTIDYIKGYDGEFHSISAPQSGFIVLGNKCPIIPLKSEYRTKESNYTTILHIRWKDGVGFVFADKSVDWIPKDIPVKEIRMGTMDHSIILYQQGDEVPLVSDELETITPPKREHWDTLNTSENSLKDLPDYYDRIETGQK